VFSGTPAQRRVAAAEDLQQRFDGSLLKGWQLKFAARGRQCDALHVEGYTNLEKSMMQALAYGTLIYGKVLPGGVNSYAFSNGFRDVVYTNEEGATYLSFGETKLTRKRIRSMLRCTDDIAKSVATGQEKPVAVPEAPRFQQLSWENAKVGTKLYDGSYKHDATIVSVDRANDIIEVRYIRSGAVEPKTLSAVARFWYVKQ